MIVGDPSVLAIESHITTAYPQQGLRGIGFFLITIKGQTYGVRENDATALANSFDEVGQRIVDRGNHTSPILCESNASVVANAFIRALYCNGDGEESYLGLSRSQFSDAVYANRIIWAPDGDSAFDDGSYVLQFDSGDLVRLIAFKRCGEDSYDPSTLNDLWLPQEDYYGILQTWHSRFENEWSVLPKAGDGNAE